MKSLGKVLCVLLVGFVGVSIKGCAADSPSHGSGQGIIGLPNPLLDIIGEYGSDRVYLEKELKGHGEYVYSVAWSHDGKYIVSGSQDATVRIWDAATGMQIGDPLGGYSNKFDGNGSNIVESVAWNHDGTRIAAGFDDTAIRIWNVKEGRSVGDPQVLKGHTEEVRSVAWSHDGTRIASGSSDGAVRIWDAVTGLSAGKVTNVNEGATVRSVKWSPGDTHIVFSFKVGSCGVRVWDIKEDKQISIIDQISVPPSVAWNSDGKHIVVGYRGSIDIYDAKTGQLLTSYQDARDRKQAREYIKEAENSRGMEMIPSSYSVAWSPDGKYIVSAASDRTMSLWNAKTGIPVGDSIINNVGYDVYSVAWSPDSTRIVSGCRDNAIRIWKIEPFVEQVHSDFDDKEIKEVVEQKKVRRAQEALEEKVERAQACERKPLEDQKAWEKVQEEVEDILPNAPGGSRGLLEDKKLMEEKRELERARKQKMKARLLQGFRKGGYR